MRGGARLRAIAAGLLCASAVVAFSGCASTHCPGEIQIGSLPADARAALNLRGGRTASRRDIGNGSVHVRMRSAAPVRTELSISGVLDVVELPLVRSGSVWSVRTTAVALDGSTTRTLARVDTGHSGQLSLDGGRARRLGVQLLAGVSAGLHQTAFGQKESRLGLLGGLRFDDPSGRTAATLAPIGPEVECDGPVFEPLLGVDALDRFAHVMFDWERGVMLCVPHGVDVSAMRARSGWFSLPWVPGTRVDVDRGSSAAERRRTIVADDRRAVLVELGGVTHHAMLDTGFSGALFCFDEPDGFELTGTIGARGHGRRGSFRVGTLEGGRFGPIDLAGAEVYTPTSASPGFIERAGYDLIVGLELLERYPLWLDFESGEVHLWTGGGSMPRPEPPAE